jgi:hypothetical protein
MIAIALASIFAFSPAVLAAAPAKGYVVKAEGSKIWLDLTAADGAAPGRGFQVYTEGEDIKHPVTGEQLGKAESRVAEGKIEEVAEKLSIGRLNDTPPSCSPGARADRRGSRSHRRPRHPRRRAARRGELRAPAPAAPPCPSS